MRKKLALIATALITSFTFIGVVVGAVSWFVTTMTVPTLDFSGRSAGAYFAYGNGVPTTEGEGNRPYGISTPRHLYNLAWLQYTGFFDDGQYYFELADSVPETGLDMTGYILPPIGTEDNPFVGNFNGKGKIIKNLTVSNDQSVLFASTNRHPDPTQVSYTAPEIVGMFGVVGNLGGAYTGTYTSSTNEIHDLGISDFTIESTTTKTLVGIAAGYVDATISNVAVNDSSIDVQANNATYVSNTFTTNLSDYGTVGYATDDYVKTIKYVDENLYDINITSNHEFNASDDGNSEGWGGSINMKTIYERLYAIKVRGISSTSAFTFRTNYYYYDGAERTGERVNRTSSSGIMHYYHGYNNNSHPYVGNFAYLNRTTADSAYMYMSGGHYESYTYRTMTKHDGYRITDGTNYMTFDGTNTIGNTTTANNGTPWHFVQASGNQYYIRYAQASETDNRYLYNNNGTLTAASGTSTNNNAKWTITKDGTHLSIVSVSDSTKKIYYDGSWKLITASGTETYYLLQSGNNYVSINSTSGATATNTTNVNDAAHFHIDGNNRVYFQKSGSTTNYYLTAYRSSNGRTTGLRVNTNATANNYYAFTYSGTTLSARYNNTTTYYARYNNGWTVATSNYNITLTEVTTDYSSMYLSNTLDSDPVTVNGTGTDYYQTSQNTQDGSRDTHMYFDYSDTTYFPLNVTADGGTFSNNSQASAALNAGNFDPLDSNTGYITAGSDYSQRDANITSVDTYRDDISKVRISKYDISNINNSFSTSYNTLEKFVDSGIYTITTAGAKRTMNQVYSENDYPRYKESKQTFYTNALTTGVSGNTYTVSDNVYGLHFMNTSINMNTIVNARNVSILGNNSDYYQLPVNAVDFNLKQKGVVNFFAGTFFAGNNSFFSLYEIFRNDDAVAKATEGEYTSYNTIRELKEIEEVYSNDVGTKTTRYSNIYKYKDKTGAEMYSVPYRVDGNQNKYVMNKNSDVETTTPYTYATMNQTDFNAYVATYGYTLRFKTSQIGVNSSSITQDNSLFYYEFPMNEGEYCLGSVNGGTGAYLLYLDIGANAAKTQRTVLYEHFSESVKAFDYPAGVAVIAVSTPASNLANGTELDETNTSNAVIYAGYKGILTISRNGNDVTLTRTGALTAAKPTLVGELMWDDTYLQYNIHNPGGDNLSDEITADVVTKDIRRLVYLDYNVNLDELMITVITDTSEDGGETYERTYYQEYANGTSTTDVEEMKVYNTNGGTRYTVEEIEDLLTYLGSVNTDSLITFTFTQEDAAAGTYEWVLGYDVDSEASGHYYIFTDYTFEITLTGSGSISFTVLTLGDKLIYIGDTEVTRAGQIVTYPSA